MDAIITRKLYACPVLSPDSLARGITSTWYHESDTATYASGMTIEYFAEGLFTWGDGTISVKLPEGWNDYNGSDLLIYDEDVTSGNKKTLLGKKYAYVTYQFRTKNGMGNVKTHKVTVKGDTNGDPF